jgi:hypothetical protein
MAKRIRRSFRMMPSGGDECGGQSNTGSAINKASVQQP